MYFTILLTAGIGLIVPGLIQFTESVLGSRQQHRKQGDDPRACL